MPKLELISPAGQNLSPAFTSEEIEVRAGEHWDLTGPLPLPKFEVVCPVCRSNEVQLRLFARTTQRKGGSKHPYRVNVSFKCTLCSCVWWHGVWVPKAMWEPLAGGEIPWRQAVRMIEEWRTTHPHCSP
jgi:hypothetical protein